MTRSAMIHESSCDVAYTATLLRLARCAPAGLSAEEIREVFGASGIRSLCPLPPELFLPVGWKGGENAPRRSPRPRGVVANPLPLRDLARLQFRQSAFRRRLPAGNLVRKERMAFTFPPQSVLGGPQPTRRDRPRGGPREFLVAHARRDDITARFDSAAGIRE
jgi:hypothetical protein